ncbi:SPFH domain-containing protein [Simiduia aestuariiviva]|uniref:Regulator of protease activity HflC (Stomatin/prohibitin superfamily) n=1 Tax=Simiduia aestuariiviva TaxID=1510459 RepID=A0A839UMV9_9GAMM|nr:SPFH domain-containing protein [Simiduia aestuariiviva]MBB3166908.1 regulator of protease activity HflC (stomatin/prohibitin superfamily) [Simiduia aestuariiviva]
MNFRFALAVIILALAGCSNPNTPAGHEGYVFENPRVFGTGGFRGELQGPSNYGVSLWRNEVINIDVRPATYTEAFQILANDDLNISFNFHAVLSIHPGSIKTVVDRFGGTHWYQRFVKEAFRTYVRNTVQKFDSGALKANREVIANEVTEKMQEYLSGTPFKLTKVVVGNIDYPQIVATAVEKKLAAQQLLAEKETQKQIAQKDAEIRIEEAKGIAQAQKIINATLTPNYLQHEAINAQLKMAESPNHTTVYIPVGTNGMPLVKNTQ